MRSNIQKIIEQRKEVEHKMKRVSDYIDTNTFQYAKGKQRDVVDRKVDVLANNVKRSLNDLKETITRELKKIESEYHKVEMLEFLARSNPRYMWRSYIDEYKKEGKL